MIKTLVTFVIAAVGFIVTVDYAHAERIVCYRDYIGDSSRSSQLQTYIPTPTFPG